MFVLSLISRVVLPLKRVQKDRSPPYAFDGLVHHLAGCIDGLGYLIMQLNKHQVCIPGYQVLFALSKLNPEQFVPLVLCLDFVIRVFVCPHKSHHAGCYPGWDGR